jgi:hypothetical protein
LSHLLSSEGVYLNNYDRRIPMWNPFAKYLVDTDEFYFNLISLTNAVIDLQDSVRELREEVDYLVDFLDD